MTAEPLIDEPLDTLIVAGGSGTREASHLRGNLGLCPRRRRPRQANRDRLLGRFHPGRGRLARRQARDNALEPCRRICARVSAISVEPDRIFIRAGALWTSAGITAGIDLALALIAEDLGETVAKHAAQQLVVYYRRPGGQSQFSALLEADRPGSRFSPLLGWARERLNERLPVERLADRAAMSQRHFARAFAADTGLTPAKAIERLRLEASRERVESGSEPIEQIAARTGFGDPERMRRAFLRAFGQPPQALRRAAKANSMPGRSYDL